MSIAARDRQARSDRLAELVQELLDAHCDTVCMADDPRAAYGWTAHVEYLKDLQRVGQRTLAELSA
jgi:hypothetical protein